MDHGRAKQKFFEALYALDGAATIDIRLTYAANYLCQLQPEDRMPSRSAIAPRLLCWRLATAFLPSMRIVNSLNSAACCPMALTGSIIGGARLVMSIASSRAPSLLTCRSCKRANSS